MGTIKSTQSEQTAFDFLLIWYKRQKDLDKTINNQVLANHDDIPKSAISQLLRLKAIVGTHAYGFAISKEGGRIVEQMFTKQQIQE